MSGDTQFRTYAIAAISREICALSGPTFEQWAYRLVDDLVPAVTWHHRGTNSHGAPVKSTVDSSGAHATHVAQYSSLQTYFSNSKPIDDLDDTIRKHPNVREILLLAAVESAPSERTNLDNAIQDWKAKHPGVLVRDLDARQIAAHIFESLDSDDLVRGLRDRIPSLARLADENAFSHSMPSANGLVSRRVEEQAVTVLLKQRRYAIIGGISGVGKSALAVQVARSLGTETLLWFDATALSNAAELKSATFGRRGIAHNLVHALQLRPCVLVLDNLKSVWPPDDLAGLAGRLSYVLVTSQAVGSRDDALILGNPPPDVAKEILLLDNPPDPSVDILRQVLARTGGHPLLLRVVGSLLKIPGWGWSQLLATLPTIVSHGEDETNQKVCRRVLSQHLPAVQDELAFFLWCDQPTVDVSLFEFCVSPLAAHNLSKRHLLAVSGGRVARLHDIVFESVRAEVTVTATQKATFRGRLDAFLQDADGLTVGRLARAHHELLLRELRSARTWPLLYAVARARVSLEDVDAFGDLASAANEIKTLKPNDTNVRAVIEAIEATHSLTTEHVSSSEGELRLRALMDVFDLLAALSLPDALRFDLRHHRAKMLVRLGRAAEAEAEFRALLSEVPSSQAVRLQLARLLNSDRPKEAAVFARAIVDATGCSPTVQIAGWVELARAAPAEVAARVQDILKLLQTVQVGDVGAAFGLVAQVSARIAFGNPDQALALIQLIGDNEPVFASDRERLDWARTQVVAAKAVRGKGDVVHAEALLRTAKSSYETVRPERRRGVARLQYAENLILLREYALARTALLEVPDGKDRNEFWLHRVAQAELGSDNFAAARAAIDGALSQLRDEKYRSAFLEVRFDVRRRQGDVDAIDDLKRAVAVAQDDKYRAQLNARLTSESSTA